jgi:hypothetical protein
MHVAYVTAGNRSSMLQDIMAGRRTEIEQLTGALLRLARRHRLSVPHPSGLLPANPGHGSTLESSTARVAAALPDGFLQELTHNAPHLPLYLLPVHGGAIRRGGSDGDCSRLEKCKPRAGRPRPRSAGGEGSRGAGLRGARGWRKGPVRRAYLGGGQADRR